MRTVHDLVHHEHIGLDDCGFARFEDHRTDDQLGRSASLQYLYVRLLLEAECSVSCIGDLDGKGFGDIEFHITIVNPLLIRRDGRGTTTSLI